MINFYYCGSTAIGTTGAQQHFRVRKRNTHLQQQCSPRPRGHPLTGRSAREPPKGSSRQKKGVRRRDRGGVFRRPANRPKSPQPHSVSRTHATTDGHLAAPRSQLFPAGISSELLCVCATSRIFCPREDSRALFDLFESASDCFPSLGYIGDWQSLL